MKLPVRLLFVVPACLAVLSGSIAQNGGNAQRKIRIHPRLEGNERLDAPQMPSFRLHLMGFGPESDYGPYHSVQVNVDAGGNNIAGDAANEPSITTIPGGRRRMAIGWRQFNSVGSNFRQGGYGYTANGGASWAFPGVLEPNVFRSDPVLDTDADSVFRYLSLEQTFYTDLWESTNGGASWVFQGEATGGDKQWMAIDRTDGPGRGFIYQAWSTGGNNYGGRQFSRSTNGGSVWMNPIFIPNRPVWGTLDVDTNGDLYICGEGSSSFYFVKSTNADNGGVTPTFTSLAVNLGGFMAYGQDINPGGLSGQAWIACDKTVGSPTSNNIYMLCSVERNASNPCDVMFSRSTDGGATWSAAKRINDDPAGQGQYHWFGTLSVAPDGRIDVVWNDTRNDPNHTMSALFYSYSLDGGATWSPNRQVSATFNPHLGYPNQNKMGDYIGMVSDIGGANVAYAATFNGEEDVYYLRIPVAPRYSVNADSIAMIEGRAFQGTVQNVWNPDGTYFSVAPVLTADLVSSVQADFTAPQDANLDLWLDTQAATLSGITESVFLYNWETSQYDFVGSTVLTQGQPGKTFSLPSDPGPYIGPNRKVRSWIRAFLSTENKGTKAVFRLDLARLLMN